MGGNVESSVFKAPDRTQWYCQRKNGKMDCQTQNLKSSAATAKNGFNGYYEMSWADFVDLMGQKPIRRCNSDYKAISNEIWVPSGQVHGGSCELKR